MSNLFTRLRKVLEVDKPVVSGTVLFVDGGVATVELPGGGRLAARGEATVGSRVYVRDGAIEGEAPNLPTGVIEI